MDGLSVVTRTTPYFAPRLLHGLIFKNYLSNTIEDVFESKFMCAAAMGTSLLMEVMCMLVVIAVAYYTLIA